MLMRSCICVRPRLHRSIIELAAQRGYTVEEAAVSVHEAMEVRTTWQTGHEAWGRRSWLARGARGEVAVEAGIWMQHVYGCGIAQGQWSDA